MATEMASAAARPESFDTDLFARMTGLEFHVEGAAGQSSHLAAAVTRTLPTARGERARRAVRTPY